MIFCIFYQVNLTGNCPALENSTQMFEVGRQKKERTAGLVRINLSQFLD